MKKVFSVSQIRDLLNQVYAEKITISRCVEILNECVPKQLALPTDRHKLRRSAMYGTRYPADGSKPFLNRGMMKDFEYGWDACIEHIKIMNEPAKTGDKSDEGCDHKESTVAWGPGADKCTKCGLTWDV